MADNKTADLSGVVSLSLTQLGCLKCASSDELFPFITLQLCASAVSLPVPVYNRNRTKAGSTLRPHTIHSHLQAFQSLESALKCIFLDCQKTKHTRTWGKICRCSQSNLDLNLGPSFNSPCIVTELN